MEQWLPRRPLILTPIIPLAWTTSWLGIVTALRSLGFGSPSPSQLRDSVLLVSAFIVVANIYNLILIYQHAERREKTTTYQQCSILLAIILIVSMVLAWGQPKQVLMPTQINWWVAAFILLNSGQAILGTYFVQRVNPVQTRTRKASLVLPVIILTVAGYILPLALAIRGSWLVALLGIAFLIALINGQWVNFTGLLSPVAATKSGIYQSLLGMNITTTVTTVFFGLDTFVMAALGERPDLISYCFALSLLGVGLSGILIAAMQRYQNDYRYGHAPGREMWYLIGGIILTVAVLLGTCWLLTKR